MQLHAQRRVELGMHTCFSIAWCGVGLKKEKKKCGACGKKQQYYCPICDGQAPRGVHCDDIRKQRAGKYRVIYIHKRKNLEFS